MKKSIKSIVLLITMVTTFLFSFNGCFSNTSGVTKDTLTVGEIIHECEATISISDQQAANLMAEDNRLEDNNYTYRYSNAWIYVIEKFDESYEYFLAVNATVKDSNNEIVYSCYTIYTLLAKNNNNLLYTSGIGHQNHCAGYCCSQCLLKEHPTNHNFYCDCTKPSTTPSCQNEARCDHSVTHTIE